MFTKVVGVTKNNPDGRNRQKIIGACCPLEKLKLEHEDDNPVDPNAVAVRRANGQQIGYLSAEIAAEVTRRSEQGYRHGAYITAITGGTKGKATRGVNLLLIIAEPGVGDREVQGYADQLSAKPEIAGGHATRTVKPKKSRSLKFLIVVAVISWAVWKFLR
jgi:hypothetical protein